METIDAQFVARNLSVPTAADNKYTRGTLLLATGSGTYPGAAVLGTLGALRAGVGMVRFMGSDRAEALILSAAPEAVLHAGKFDAAVVGSGYDFSMTSLIDSVARTCDEGALPLIVDAGALVGVRGWAQTNPLVIATPHAGEAVKMFEQLSSPAKATRQQIEGDVATFAAELAKLTGATIVLKAAQTAVATAEGDTWLFTAPGAWGGVAGSGDVLAGTIGALVALSVAQSTGVVEPHLVALACATAVGLHGLAAARASRVLGANFQPGGAPGRPVAASDIAAALSRSIGELLMEETPACIS